MITAPELRGLDMGIKIGAHVKSSAKVIGRSLYDEIPCSRRICRTELSEGPTQKHDELIWQAKRSRKTDGDVHPRGELCLLRLSKLLLPRFPSRQTKPLPCSVSVLARLRTGGLRESARRSSVSVQSTAELCTASTTSRPGWITTGLKHRLLRRSHHDRTHPLSFPFPEHIPKGSRSACPRSGQAAPQSRRKT